MNKRDCNNVYGWLCEIDTRLDALEGLKQKTDAVQPDVSGAEQVKNAVGEKRSFRRLLEIEIDKSSDFVRSGEYDKLSDISKSLFDDMQLQMGLLLKSIVRFDNSLRGV